MLRSAALSRPDRPDRTTTSHSEPSPPAIYGNADGRVFPAGRPTLTLGSGYRSAIQTTASLKSQGSTPITRSILEWPPFKSQTKQRQRLPFSYKFSDGCASPCRCFLGPPAFSPSISNSQSERPGHGDNWNVPLHPRGIGTRLLGDLRMSANDRVTVASALSCPRFRSTA